MSATTPPDLTAAKTALRDQLVTSRNRLNVFSLGEAARALAAQILELTEVRRAATVTAYVSIGSEPGTGVLLDGLVAAGKRVILPVLQPDDDLDWAVYHGPTSLAPARRGLLEPAGRPLGVDAVATADVVIVPGLAVGADGTRLGRGGGSYDRALGRVPVGTPVLVLLYDGELLSAVPTEPHDRRVTTAVTPTRVARLR